MKQKLQTYLENFDKLYLFYNIKYEDDADIFNLLDDAGSEVSDDQLTGTEDNADTSSLTDDSNNNLTGTDQQNNTQQNITEEITSAVKMLSLISKFEQLYYELMVTKAKLEKVVSNPYEFLNMIKKFENMLILLLHKLDKNNVDKIDEILDVYTKTLKDYLLSLK